MTEMTATEVTERQQDYARRGGMSQHRINQLAATMTTNAKVNGFSHATLKEPEHKEIDGWISAS